MSIWMLRSKRKTPFGTMSVHTQVDAIRITFNLQHIQIIQILSICRWSLCIKKSIIYITSKPHLVSVLWSISRKQKYSISLSSKSLIKPNKEVIFFSNRSAHLQCKRNSSRKSYEYNFPIEKRSLPAKLSRKPPLHRQIKRAWSWSSPRKKMVVQTNQEQ